MSSGILISQQQSKACLLLLPGSCSFPHPVSTHRSPPTNLFLFLFNNHLCLTFVSYSSTFSSKNPNNNKTNKLPLKSHPQTNNVRPHLQTPPQVRKIFASNFPKSARSTRLFSSPLISSVSLGLSAVMFAAAGMLYPGLSFFQIQNIVNPSFLPTTTTPSHTDPKST